ncbi:uncharacterized protein [Panulirus ornatus]|uniref:uncharacterized protein isoform X6 n=1 Tax=Panulirus ornatus TaxID=150431 RepID=UPI003A853F6C
MHGRYVPRNLPIHCWLRGRVLWRRRRDREVGGTHQCLPCARCSRGTWTDRVGTSPENGTARRYAAVPSWYFTMSHALNILANQSRRQVTQYFNKFL